MSPGTGARGADDEDERGSPGGAQAWGRFQPLPTPPVETYPRQASRDRARYLIGVYNPKITRRLI